MESPTEQHQHQQHHQRLPTRYHRRHLSSPRAIGLKRSRSKMDDYLSSMADRSRVGRYERNDEIGSGSGSASITISPSSSASVGSSTGVSSINVLESPMALPQRYEGDGLDFRSPTNAQPQEVIDLTGSDDHEDSTAPREHATPSQQPLQPTRIATRPPRFSAEVINLEDDSPPQFSRTLPRPQSSRSNRDDPLILQRRQTRPAAETSSSTDDNEVQIIDWRSVPQQDANQLQPRRIPRRDIHYQARPSRASIGDLLVSTDPRHHSLRHQQSAPLNRRPTEAALFSRVRAHLDNFTATAPLLDYTRIGFALGSLANPFLGRQESVPSPRARQQPVREELPPVRGGFTRSPHEDDILICPNCRQELCTEGDENKKQVSVIKNCGHVYCGECAPKTRSKANAKGTRSAAAAKSSSSSTRAGKASSSGAANEPEHVPIKPITTCVVEGCGKKATARDVIHVFL